MKPTCFLILQSVAGQLAAPTSAIAGNAADVKSPDLSLWVILGYLLLGVTVSVGTAVVCFRIGKKHLSSIEEQRNKLRDRTPPPNSEEMQKELQRLDDHPLQIYGLHLLASHPLVVGTVLTATCMVFMAAALKLILISFCDCPWDQWSNLPNNWILREFAAAGLRDYVFAILGVLAGIIATLVVEKTSSARTANIESTSAHIRDQVSELRHVLGVRPIKDLRELISEIKSVFKMAQERPSNWLWVMNPTAAYGYFNTFDADNILECAGLPVGQKTSDRPDRLSKLKRSQFDEHQKELVDDHKELKSELEKAIGIIRDAYSSGDNSPAVAEDVDEFGGVKFQRVECATLSPASISEPSHYLREFVLPAITGKESVSQTDYARVAVLDVEQYWEDKQRWNEATKKEKVFFIPLRKLQPTSSGEVGFDRTNEAAVLEWLLRHLNEKQKRYIADFNALSMCVREMKHVPMQMFMSLDPAEKNSICLVVFSNRYTLSRSNDLAAFRITEPSTIRTFKSMFMAIVAQERVEPESTPPNEPKSESTASS